jgi:taurine dioxygenase
MTITTTPLSEALGAEVHGLDPAHLDETDRQALREAFLEYGVLLARGLAGMTPEQHIELSRVFGECAIHPIPTIRMKGHPEIIVLAAEIGDTLAEDDPTREDIVGHIPWHSDLTYTASPCRGSILVARVVPPELGMTGYIDTAAVYDALPDDLRERIEGRNAIHSLGPIQEALKSAARADYEMEGGEAPAFEQVKHPLVHVHPESGRKVLNVSPAFIQSIEGLPEEESRALIDELIAFATQDRFVYLHRWEVGDLIVWDNWRTMHLATGHKKKHGRRMHRTTLEPGRLPGALAA